MGTLWAADDTQTKERRNREAMTIRRVLPMHDINQAGTITLAAKPIDGVMLTDTAAAIYTVPAIAAVQLFNFTLVNTSASPVQATVNLVPSAGSISVATTIFNDLLAAGETLEIDIPYFMTSGGTVQAHAATTGVIAASLNVLEFTNQPDGLSLKIIQGVALTGSNVTHYTVPGSGVKYAILLAVTFCNTTTNPHTVSYYKTPSGQASGAAARLMANPTLASRESFWIDPNHILEPGDFLEGKASTTGVVSARLTVLEVL